MRKGAPTSAAVPEIVAVSPNVATTVLPGTSHVEPVTSLVERLKSRAIGSVITAALAYGVTLRADIAALIGGLEFVVKLALGLAKK